MVVAADVVEADVVEAVNVLLAVGVVVVFSVVVVGAVIARTVATEFATGAGTALALVEPLIVEPPPDAPATPVLPVPLELPVLAIAVVPPAVSRAVESSIVARQPTRDVAVDVTAINRIRRGDNSRSNTGNLSFILRR